QIVGFRPPTPGVRSRKPLLYPLSYGGSARRARERSRVARLVAPERCRELPRGVQRGPVGDATEAWSARGRLPRALLSYRENGGARSCSVYGTLTSVSQ